MFDCLKGDFSGIESSENFDFLVDGTDFIDVNYDSNYFSYSQLRHIYAKYKKNNIGNLYVLIEDYYTHPYHYLFNKIKDYETLIGVFTLYSVDISKLLSKYRDVIQG